MSYNKISVVHTTAIVITKNELITNWLEEIVSLVGNNCCFYVVVEVETLKKIDKLFLKFNSKIFGEHKWEQNRARFIIKTVTNYELELALKSHQRVLNFTSLEIPIIENNNYLQFLISGRAYSLREVISNTLLSYKKVELAVQSNAVVHKTSTIRLNPFAINKNTELILASFLVILKSISRNDAKNSFKSELYSEAKYISGTISLSAYFKYVFSFISKLKNYILYNEQWILGYSFNPKTIGVDLKNDIKIVPPKDRFWADPVVIEEHGRYYVFIEELIYKNKIAHLSVFELKEDGSYTKPEIILKKPYHLSYPNVFKYGKTYYMIPETAHNDDIQLYEAECFPYKWKLKKILMENIKASDTTLLYKNNKWWLFASIKRYDKGTYDNDLSVFHSESLFSNNWEPHLISPIKQDICYARQGGPFFYIGPDCYRVSQNCESNYGYGFNLSKLQAISETNFKEDLVYSFTPNKFKNILGVHTYNHINGKLRVYDILIRTLK